MSNNEWTVQPAMLHCQLKKLNVVTGKMPEGDSSTNINVEFHVDINDIPDAPNLKAVRLSISMNNEQHFYYEIEAEGEAVFGFEDGSAKEKMIEYINNVGIKQVSASIRTAIDSATALFPYGSAQIPDMDLSMIISNK